MGNTRPHCHRMMPMTCQGDYYGNKRLELSGQLVEVLFEERLDGVEDILFD